MTRINQKIFEKIATDLLIKTINRVENKKIEFFRYGNEGVETDVIYHSKLEIIGIEVFGHYQNVKKGNKLIPIKLSKNSYSKGSDIVEFLTIQVNKKITKKYKLENKWLVCVNRFPAVTPQDFEQIFLLNYHNGWGSFKRVFIIFDKHLSTVNKSDFFEIYEINKKYSKLKFIGEEKIARDNKGIIQL